MSKTFKCALCEGEFPYIEDERWNDEKAMEEYRHLYPGRSEDNVTLVCDDCHIIIEEWRMKGPQKPQ